MRHFPKYPDLTKKPKLSHRMFKMIFTYSYVTNPEQKTWEVIIKDIPSALRMFHQKFSLPNIEYTIHNIAIEEIGGN